MRLLLVALLASTLGWGAAAATTDLVNDAGFRIDRYRSPVDRPAEGFAVIDAAAVQALRARAIRIHTTPLERTTETDFSGLWLQNKPRSHLPNSIWLPNVGSMPLDRTMQAFFQIQLEELTGIEMSLFIDQNWAGDIDIYITISTFTARCS